MVALFICQLRKTGAFSVRPFKLPSFLFRQRQKKYAVHRIQAPRLGTHGNQFLLKTHPPIGGMAVEIELRLYTSS